MLTYKYIVYEYIEKDTDPFHIPNVTFSKCVQKKRYKNCECSKATKFQLVCQL